MVICSLMVVVKTFYFKLMDTSRRGDIEDKGYMFLNINFVGKI